MNHEFWNEIGNLYFMFGAYEPAIHAYLCSIKLENTFGRSYSNLAMAYVQTGKYSEAIKLYRRSIELLADKKEKATTWNRLGILYRQIKEYDNALEAYQRADLIMPQENAGNASEIRTETKLPLTVSLPEINLDAILAKGYSAKLLIQNSAMLDINTELEMAEWDQVGLNIEEVMALPPEKTSGPCEFENYSQTEDAAFESPVIMQSEWKLAYAEENIVIESSVAAIQESNPTEELNNPVPVETQGEAVAGDSQADALPIPETMLEIEDNLEASIVHDEVESVAGAAFFENNGHAESIETVINETDIVETQDLQTDFPMADLSPEERQTLEMEIIKYQQETSKNPRSYILWEGLGEAYKSAGRYKDAIQAFQKAITMNPTNAMSHYRLGLVYAAERKVQEAINSFKKVLELDPNSTQAHASLASQYRKMGFTEAAQEHIEKARAMQLEEESDYNHACLEAIFGNNERALELLEVALQSKQTYVTWAKNDPDFDSLRNDQRFQMLLSTHAAVAG